MGDGRQTFGAKRGGGVMIEIMHGGFLRSNSVQAAAVSPFRTALTSLQGLERPTTRRSNTPASDTDDRKIWICWPSSSHKSWVTQRAPVLVQPLVLPVLQRVAAMGSSTARMMSAMRSSPEGRDRR